MVFDQATFIGLGALLRRAAAAARSHGYHVTPDVGAPYPQPSGNRRGLDPDTTRGCKWRW